MIDAVVFDMDGVLIDSEPLWRLVMNDVFTEVGFTLTDIELKSTAGTPIEVVVALWLKQKNIKHCTAPEVTDQIVTRLVKRLPDEATAMPGVHKLITEFRNRGLALGLATSSPMRLVEAAIKVAKLEGIFTALCSAEHERRGKPAPDVYLSACRQLGVSPGRSLAIEDSANGVKSAKAAGMKCLYVPAPDGIFHRNLDFDHSVATLEEIKTEPWEQFLALFD